MIPRTIGSLKNSLSLCIRIEKFYWRCNELWMLFTPLKLFPTAPFSLLTSKRPETFYILCRGSCGSVKCSWWHAVQKWATVESTLGTTNYSFLMYWMKISIVRTRRRRRCRSVSLNSQTGTLVSYGRISSSTRVEDERLAGRPYFMSSWFLITTSHT